MRRLALTTLLLVLLVTAASAAAIDERRVALVIGNGAYAHTTVLPNPPNDGRAVAAKLRGLGFEVLEGIDLDRRGTEDLIQQFSRRLRGADVGLFFYAGHGLQVGGSNYIVPIDAALQDESDLDFETVRLDIVLNQLERQPSTNLVFLDACRDNPLARSLARGMGATRSAAIGRGLAIVAARGGTLIAYATEPDNVALDGNGENSPFTTALLQHIDTPGLEVRQMLTRVRQDVIRETDNQQVPWEHSSLTGDFFFRSPPEPEPVTPAAIDDDPAPPPITDRPADTGTAELIMWQAVQSFTEPEDKIAALKLYLETYPQGAFADLAEFRVAALTASTVAPPPDPEPDLPRGPVAPGPADIEQSLALTREDRRAVQSALTMLGYDTRGVDGAFGNNTRRALRDYQRARGQLVTGYLAADTLSALKAVGDAIDVRFNTCQSAFNSQCDEGRFRDNASDACAAGTDSFDCQSLALREPAATKDN